MNNENAFHYTYSAPDHQEVLSIRNKYLPRKETKLEELKRLDSLVQSSGIMESLSLGVGGCLIFGLGLCLSATIIGNILWPGIVLGLVGLVGMLFAYPVYRRLFTRARQQYTPRILQLTAELTGED